MNAAAVRTRPTPEPDLDGRRRRGQDNKARIVAAMLEMVREGDLAPSAEQVASRADVGLRTVFRHFQDMDSLYGEMATAIQGELADIMAQPFRAATWRGRILELVGRRAAGFERVVAYHRAGVATRHRSPVLADRHVLLVRISRDIIVRQLPPEVAADRPLVEALDLLLSIEAWSRLRVEQALSPKAARDAVERSVRKLIGDEPR
jgi:AcrR family transcriptional regulator